MKKIVIIASTSGSILSKTLVFSEIKEHIFEVISDRYCGAIEYAKKNGIKTKVLLSYTGLEFSNKLLEYFKNKKVDCFLSFYTRIFAGDFLTYYFNRIYNFHPSLLPASLPPFSPASSSSALPCLLFLLTTPPTQSPLHPQPRHSPASSLSSCSFL